MVERTKPMTLLDTFDVEIILFLLEHSDNEDEIGILALSRELDTNPNSIKLHLERLSLLGIIDWKKPQKKGQKSLISKGKNYGEALSFIYPFLDTLSEWYNSMRKYMSNLTGYEHKTNQKYHLKKGDYEEETKKRYFLQEVIFAGKSNTTRDFRKNSSQK